MKEGGIESPVSKKWKIFIPGIDIRKTVKPGIWPMSSSKPEPTPSKACSDFLARHPPFHPRFQNTIPGIVFLFIIK